MNSYSPRFIDSHVWDECLRLEEDDVGCTRSIVPRLNPTRPLMTCTHWWSWPSPWQGNRHKCGTPKKLKTPPPTHTHTHHHHHPMTLCLPFVLCRSLTIPQEDLKSALYSLWREKACLFPNQFSLLQYWKCYVKWVIWGFLSTTCDTIETEIKRGGVDSIVLTPTSWITR